LGATAPNFFTRAPTCRHLRRRLLSGPYDECDARLTLTVGVGGLDAEDFTAMLERMYIRWAEGRGLAVRTLDRSAGEGAGVKSVEIELVGRWAYGLLRGEKGAHRLVRVSPFNSKGLRQTSFAGVEVMPVLAEDVRGSRRRARPRASAPHPPLAPLAADHRAP